MALVLVNSFHYVFSCKILTDLISLVKSLWRVRVRRVREDGCDLAPSKRVDRFAEVGSVVRTDSTPYG